ncbi:PREDICTED: ADP-ribosylation factor-like protein 15 [Tauraco erythrolophus]|uniref:ADP-ribosylation factor-like protein 15 n=2 Tax=Neoaves TaxID=3078114 RepID=UPI0005234976|nr:PREDICTED: ADP-ribosylation factor-like protein 15 [Tauraco erythrolophus]
MFVCLRIDSFSGCEQVYLWLYSEKDWETAKGLCQCPRRVRLPWCGSRRGHGAPAWGPPHSAAPAGARVLRRRVVGKTRPPGLRYVGLWNRWRSSLVRCFRALCCKGPPPPRPEYDLVCIGLTGSGKTSLLSQLCSESPENIVSTTGFSIKAVPFQNAILNVKELGGADNIRKYWSRYYQGSQGVIFVLDSASSEDDLETARNELHSALQHPQLCTLPFLILANHQDKPAARSVQENQALTTSLNVLVFLKLPQNWYCQCIHNDASAFGPHGSTSEEQVQPPTHEDPSFARGPPCGGTDHHPQQPGSAGTAGDFLCWKEIKISCVQSWFHLDW